MSNFILWFDRRGAGHTARMQFQQFFKRVKINPQNVIWQNLPSKIPTVPKKQSPEIDAAAKAMEFFAAEVNRIRPKLIVINDDSCLAYFLGQKANLWNYRGSVYRYQGIPVIVINDINVTLHGKITYLPWVMLMDIKKLSRFYTDTVRKTPKFTWSLCDTPEKLDQFYRAAENSALISADTETASKMITVAGYCTVEHSGRVHSWVIPFSGGTLRANWLEPEVEEYAWKTIRAVHELPIPFAMQNGMYDQEFFIKYRCPIKTWVYDAAVMFRSTWASAPRNLGFISSILIDEYNFWKDENKSSKQTAADRWKFTEDQLQAYWRYNAQDVYYTALNCLFLAQVFPPWARQNYIDMMSQVLGPSFEMSNIPWPVDTDRQQKLITDWRNESERELARLRIMADDPEFNPQAPAQVVKLLYHILGAVMPFKPRRGQPEYSADEKILNIVRTQHPIFHKVIDTLWATKKPANNVAKYDMPLVNGKYFISTVDAIGTETRRYAGREHYLGYGTNPQNFPPVARKILVAPEGYVILSVDYAQSDAYYTAFTLQDPVLIEELTGPRDSHCVLASEFFARPYEEIYAGYKEKAEWVVHSTKGVRQNSKRIRYGCNYLMQAKTLYIVMSHESVVGTAQAMGYKDAATWTANRCVQFCDHLISIYWKRYATGRKNFDLLCEEVMKNGGLYTDMWGQTRAFFGNIVTDDTVQREFASQIGQGGTAGAVNKALFELATRPRNYGDYFILPQVHDEIILFVKEDKLDLVPELLECIKQPCAIHDRTFTVPVEPTVGYTWKQTQIPWPCTLEEMREAENSYV